MREMSVVGYWKIRQELLRVDGVANVAIWGSISNRSMWRSIPQKLAENGVSLQQVMDQTADSLDAGLLRYSDGHVIGTGGFVEQGGQRLDVQTSCPSSAWRTWPRCHSRTVRTCAWMMWPT